MVAVLDADVAVVESDAIISEDLSKMSWINLKGILDLMKKFWTLCILYFRSSMTAHACSQLVATLRTMRRAATKVKSSQFSKIRN